MLPGNPLQNSASEMHATARTVLPVNAAGTVNTAMPTRPITIGYLLLAIGDRPARPSRCVNTPPHR